MSLGDGNLRERVAGLERDNARLQSQLDDGNQMYHRALERGRELESLVRDMYGYAVNREMELCNACVEANGDYADCAACDEYDGACGIAKKRFEELYADRVAELGIGTEGLA